MKVLPFREESLLAPAGPGRSQTGPPLLGSSAAFVEALRQATAVASLDVGVLLTGETGTGKTAVARLVHERSRRAREPFVELNCAALPEGLVESELFGARPGAHSTATSAVEGRIAAAGRGTLFLDEVSELSPGAQAKLLQFLDRGEYCPLGAARPRRADLRLLAASNIDLHAAAAGGRFRADLLHRLDVFPIHLPSLAERPGDVVELAVHFCAASARRHGLAARRLCPSALRELDRRPWPGNVRELQHRIEAGVLRASLSGSEFVTTRDLFPRSPGAVAAPPPALEARSLADATRAFQRDFALRALAEEDGNVSRCARRLGVARSHLYTLLKDPGA